MAALTKAADSGGDRETWEKYTAAADIANWMGNLPTYATLQPINWLAIPGSHDTFSYTISKTSEITPDDPSLLIFNKIPCVRCIAKNIIYRWSVTQGSTCTEQLNAGIRYLDLRVAVNPESKELCLIHGLYGILVKDALQEILNFLKTHSKEVVLLDFQHFYGFEEDTHQKLIEEIEKAFDLLLCPFSNDTYSLSLNWLWKQGFQVFIFYRNPVVVRHRKLWPGSFIPNPWPNTVNASSMISFLDANYNKGRPEMRFYVTQGVLTPNSAFVMRHLMSTLKGSLVPLANSAMANWLLDKKAGRSGINVVMVDFASESTTLIEQILDLNKDLEVKY